MQRNVHIETHMYAATMTKVIDSLLVKGTREGKPPCAIVFSTRIDFNDYQSDGDVEPDPVGGYLHVACFSPMNYVHVLAAFTERPIFGQGYEQLAWQPIACHDSCWREDGVKSVIVEAVQMLGKAALKAFKINEDDISFHLSMEHLSIDVEDPVTVLASGLSKKERHGKLTIPGIDA